MSFILFAVVLLSVADELSADKICCPGLRCYTNDPPFDYLPLPQCPKDQNITMTLYSPKDPTNGQIITRDTIPSTFKASIMTIFIVNGWLAYTTTQWMTDMKTAFLNQGDYNVITVNYIGAFGQILFNQCASNTRTLGGEIALISNNTIKAGKSSKDLMYCVGHSLGAHACGHAGAQGQFGRISGMDPAGPEFQGHNWTVGLNPSCATLVDNIHTNGVIVGTIGAGTMTPLGHIDFYPNGGRSQPGCLLNVAGKNLLQRSDFYTCNNKLDIECYVELQSAANDILISCSHLRAVDLFTESIRSQCFLTGFNCSDPQNTPGSCKESKKPIQSMGFYANKYSARGIFYLETRACSPYCC